MFLSLALNDINKIVHEDIDSYMYAYHVQFNHFILKVVIYHKKMLYLKDMFKSIFGCIDSTILTHIASMLEPWLELVVYETNPSSITIRIHCDLNEKYYLLLFSSWKNPLVFCSLFSS